MKSEQDKIAALEKALAEAHLKLRGYDELIHHANQRYKTDIKNNFGMPPLARAPAPTTTSRPSAARLSARATRTTSAAPAAAPRPARRPSCWRRWMPCGSSHRGWARGRCRRR